MKKYVYYENEYYQDKFFFIKLMVMDSGLESKEIGEVLGIFCDLNFESKKISDHSVSWSYCMWFKGSMDFFCETEIILKWIEWKNNSISRVLSKFGYFRLQIGLPGKNFVASTLSFDAAQLAIKLGVQIFVEVFPQLEFGDECVEIF